MLYTSDKIILDYFWGLKLSLDSFSRNCGSKFRLHVCTGSRNVQWYVAKHIPNAVYSENLIEKITVQLLHVWNQKAVSPNLLIQNSSFNALGYMLKNLAILEFWSKAQGSMITFGSNHVLLERTHWNYILDTTANHVPWNWSANHANKSMYFPFVF